MSERPHGTRAKYVLERCRCEDCRRANREYEQQRALRKLRQRWGAAPPDFVPANEARDHLRWLSSVGVGTRRVCKQTGLSRTTLQRVKHERRGRVKRETAEAILGVSAEPIVVSSPGAVEESDIDALIFGVKVCSSCGLPKARNSEQFASDATTKDGLTYVCRECRNRQQQARKAARRG